MKRWFLVLLGLSIPVCGQDGPVAFGQTVPFELKPGAKAAWDWKASGVRQAYRHVQNSRTGSGAAARTVRPTIFAIRAPAGTSVHLLDGSRVQGGAVAGPARFSAGSYVERTGNAGVGTGADKPAAERR